MSSDSEDDCYGNIAQKLQSIKSKYKEDKIESTNLLSDSVRSDSSPNKVDSTIEIIDNSNVNYVRSKDDSDVEEISLDEIIAQNSRKRLTRNSKRNADISIDNILPSRARKKSKAYNNVTSETLATNVYNTNHSLKEDVLNPTETPSVNNSVNLAQRRGRGRRRGLRGRITSNSSMRNTNNTEAMLNNTSNTYNNSPLEYLDRRVQASPMSHQALFPTYSIGNTDEYPDESYNQPLFAATNTTNDIVIVGENEPENISIDENEELSVKVYWQNCEMVKFTVRRFQNFTQIYEFFAKRENVSHNKLFFTYNDKILKKNDTPDTITYSIAKFIDGGIVNQSVSTIIQKESSTMKDGITLKFQCQNVKKPFKTTIQRDEKLAVAFIMCAEHFEKPLEKLKFHFDGDLISGKSTPIELDLEGGECIDVTVCS